MPEQPYRWYSKHIKFIPDNEAKCFKEEGKRCLTIKNLELCQIGAVAVMSW